jgi:hypothetical protein
MKKTFIGMLVIVTFFISACARDRDLGIYDKNIPAAKQTTLEISPYLTVKNFDGKKVKWKIAGFGSTVFGDPKATIVIPSGEHTITADYYVYNFGDTSSAKDLKRTFDFMPGRTYSITPVVIDRKVHIESKDITKE